MTPEERSQFIEDIATAIHTRSSDQGLTADEISYVRLAIHKESQSIKLRQAIIEKTLTSLVWMIVIGLGAVILEWLKNHGYKP